jgi:hypothetical protein
MRAGIGGFPSTALLDSPTVGDSSAREARSSVSRRRTGITTPPRADPHELKSS